MIARSVIDGRLRRRFQGLSHLLRSLTRAAVVGLRRLRWWRCNTFELLGSARYSRTALNDFDRKLAPYLADGGVFVEAGANDGFRKSNTYYLERFGGWTGILIEPIPALAEQCRKHRKRSRVYQCALVGPEQQTPVVTIRYADMLSEIRVDGQPGPRSFWEWDESYDLEVPARTLSQVLADAGATRIDFLSLDLQGYEAAALRGLDFDRWAPAVMLVEVEDDAAQRAVEDVIGSRYERVARLARHDMLYRIADGSP